VRQSSASPYSARPTTERLHETLSGLGGVREVPLLSVGPFCLLPTSGADDAIIHPQSPTVRQSTARQVHAHVAITSQAPPLDLGWLVLCTTNSGRGIRDEVISEGVHL
jgi:hypothetical protein